ncbi:transcriptional regulator [Planotetraspora thailandica]|uniref:Transcriptional regulator n=1 Tax=Planotetraspora thailandica TaxID=487172 RepID=A0A8J4DFU1_9ACTN|nr:LuxR family transcriptional regulator [Planotetraspora thailandica]GII59686.1 transcriptional regulator [Planotetraspora thailandica]
MLERTSSLLIGRDAELERLVGLLDSPSSQALALLGEAGIGKTSLLSRFVEQAREKKVNVLSVVGDQSETHLAFAGLHQLLGPILSSAGSPVADLTPPHRNALLAAFGLAQEFTAPDRLLIGIATVTLLIKVAERSPLLLVVDDTQWLDYNSRDVLAFVGRRLRNERIVMVVSTREQTPPSPFGHDVAHLRLEPLTETDANRLLDAQTHPPRGLARSTVLAQAQGNPMALVELTRAIATDRTWGGYRLEDPLPLSERLERLFSERVSALPQACRTALLFAAAAGPSELSEAGSAGLPGLEAQIWQPAENAGLITVSGAGVAFSHPLVRSAVYHAASFADRADAHRRLAGVLTRQPDRRAWHLAKATLHPDESVALLLEETAAEALRRGGCVSAALAMERAAELSPDPEGRARRLVIAADYATTTGQATWVRDLATRASAATSDPTLRAQANRAIGWALAWTKHQAEALRTLVTLGEETAAWAPLIAWSTLGPAASVAYHLGAPAGRTAVRQVVDRLSPREAAIHPGAPDWADAVRLFTHTATSPYQGRAAALADIRRITERGLDILGLSTAGPAAWVLDESDLAVRILRVARERLRKPGIQGASGAMVIGLSEARERLHKSGVQGASGAMMMGLAWACLDTARWDEALDACAEASELAAAYGMEIVTAGISLTAATLAALRGDTLRARDLVATAVAAVDPGDVPFIAARERRVTGLIALVEGRFEAACTILRQVLGDDGVPLHYHASYFALVDFASAAVRTDQVDECRAIVEHAVSQVDGDMSPRLEQLVAHARALLSGRDQAEEHYTRALADPAGEQWPFERASLRLDYAEWLRRRRRINEAKPLLISAVEVFRRIGAKPYVQRAETELRASGVTLPGTAASDGLAQLTPQQREIVRLAAQGLTNREIAERLSLSPRTVGSHLYRSFPLLGVTARHQIRDVLGSGAG